MFSRKYGIAINLQNTNYDSHTYINAVNRNGELFVLTPIEPVNQLLVRNGILFLINGKTEVYRLHTCDHNLNLRRCLQNV